METIPELPIPILESLSCLGHHCSNPNSLNNLLKCMETHIDYSLLTQLLQSTIAFRITLASELLTKQRKSDLSLVFNVISQDMMLLHLIRKFEVPETLNIVADESFLCEFINGCLFVSKLELMEKASRRAVEFNLKDNVLSPEYHQAQQLLILTLLLGRCLDLTLPYEERAVTQWGISRCLVDVLRLGQNPFSSDQVYLLGELSSRLFDLLDTGPDQLRLNGFNDFIEIVRRNSSCDYSSFIAIWNLAEEPALAQILSSSDNQGQPRSTKEISSSVHMGGNLLYEPYPTSEERNYLQILRAFIDPSINVREGYLLIALRLARSAYSESSMNDIVQLLAADPFQCEIFFPPDLKVIKPLTNLEIATAMLRNLQKIKLEKQQRNQTKTRDYSEINDVGKSWELKNKTIQFVRNQQQHEHEEESSDSLQGVQRQPESIAPRATAIDFITTSDSTAYSIRPWAEEVPPQTRVVPSSHVTDPVANSPPPPLSLANRSWGAPPTRGGRSQRGGRGRGYRSGHHQRDRHQRKMRGSIGS
eukprot:Gregarina_sp_Poly_1__9696@NODE_615_length_7127_cov_142_509207_g471_i0_p3_GENE_NODE_615_length_7127_cov_142_509207_g471_i0NODE_615_length_7127_cov_142_509207_g471_i0_p3_ORF_typecomplete_len532_score61_87_NODE_615_length_7127_cov_142_509207_g471_i035475142